MPSDATPTPPPLDGHAGRGAHRPTLGDVARAEAAKRRGVPPLSRHQIHAAKGECPDCYELGHICRPCRAKRYADRQPSERAAQAFLAVIYWSIGLLVVAIAAVWAITNG